MLQRGNAVWTLQRPIADDALLHSPKPPQNKNQMLLLQRPPISRTQERPAHVPTQERGNDPPRQASLKKNHSLPKPAPCTRHTCPTVDAARAPLRIGCTGLNGSGEAARRRRRATTIDIPAVMDHHDLRSHCLRHKTFRPFAGRSSAGLPFPFYTSPFHACPLKPALSP